MWINFEPASKTKYAIRPFLGGVNGISGDAAIGDMTTLMRQMNALTPKQDYMVLPDQKWLDGIATSPGIVKQFVATKLNPPRQKPPQQPSSDFTSNSSNIKTSGTKKDWEDEEGGTIEWQVTGQDTIGGFQLQLIPEFDIHNMSAGRRRDVCGWGDDWEPQSYINPVPADSEHFDVLKSPLELGLRPGDIIHVKNMKKPTKERPKVVKDLLTEGPIKLTVTDIVDISIKFDQPKHVKYNVHHLNDMESLVSLVVRIQYVLRRDWNYS
jgi:hypothetical protein